MALIRVTEPAPLFTVDGLKAHCRIEDDVSDRQVDEWGQAAVDHLDGPEGSLDRCLAPQTWDWFPDACDYPWLAATAAERARLFLPLRPLISVDEVEYAEATAGTLTPWTDFNAYGVGQRGWISPIYGGTWPTVQGSTQPFRIRFTAGYSKSDGEGGTVENVPFAIKAALKLIVGDLFSQREGQSAAQIYPNPTVDRLLQPYRRWAV